MIIKDALKLLGNKVDSIMKASQQGLALNDENISKIMLDNNIEELKGKVANLVNQGILAPTDTVGANTFLVGSENEAGGKVVHPRVQFTFGSLEKDLQEALNGKKKGDIVTFKEDKLRFVVQEVYSIVPPKPAPAPTPVAPAPAAPAETENSKPVETFAPVAAPAEATPAPADQAAEQSSKDASQAAPAAPAAGN
jgi:hypothetical protein